MMAALNGRHFRFCSLIFDLQDQWFKPNLSGTASHAPAVGASVLAVLGLTKSAISNEVAEHDLTRTITKPE
jgi:hypothetical protein